MLKDIFQQTLIYPYSKFLHLYFHQDEISIYFLPKLHYFITSTLQGFPHKLQTLSYNLQIVYLFEI